MMMDKDGRGKWRGSREGEGGKMKKINKNKPRLGPPKLQEGRQACEEGSSPLKTIAGQ
jgi:hypothetical protein